MATRPIIRFRAGWFFMDTALAIGIVAILMTVMATAVTKQQRAAARLADARDAIRAAEQSITALQTGQPLPQPAGMTIRVRKLDTPCDVPRCAWASVTVTSGTASRQLVGLVRADAIPTEAP